MMNRKIYSLLSPFRHVLPFSCLLKISGQKILFPFWHAVAPVAPPHLRHLYPVPAPKSFRDDILWLLRYYKPIGLPEVIRLVTGESIPDKPVMHVTIDDGFRESADFIAPVLLELGVPATFFISPAFIGNHDMSYRCKASVIYDSLLKPDLLECIPSGIAKAFLKRGIHFSDFRKAVLNISYQHRDMLDHLALVAGINFNEYLQEYKPYLDEQQVRWLLVNGFHIGAHSIDHPWFTELTPEEQWRQVIQSTEIVANIFGEKMPCFAFPFSDHFMSLDFYRQLHANPSAPLVTFGTSGLKKDVAPRSAQRVAMEVRNKNASGIIFSEYFYYLLKALAGKNTLARVGKY